MVRIAAAARTVVDEAVAFSSSVVVKVRHKSEILRFRVIWPLDVSEVLATVSDAFRFAGNVDATLGEHEPSGPHTSDDLSPIFLYHADQGKLLELCAANASDFARRHTNPMHPIRLVTSARRASVRHDDPSEHTLHSTALASTETDFGWTLVHYSSGAVVRTDARKSIAVDDKGETSKIAITGDLGEIPSTLPPSLGKEFLTATAAAALAPPSARKLARTGRELGAAQKAVGALSDMPQAARKAADVLGNALKGPLERFNRALPTPWLSPANSELQCALLASAELHEAREKSAAEARARLARVLDKYQVKLRPVEADGNCQFRALSVQLCGDEAQHAVLRKRVTQHLRDRRERFEGYMLGEFEEYLERMERDGEWGDNVTLQAASDILSRDILVLTDRAGTSELLELHPEIASEEEQRRPLCLAFLTEVHYDAVLM